MPDHLPGAVELESGLLRDPHAISFKHSGSCPLPGNQRTGDCRRPRRCSSSLDVRAYLLGSIFVVLCQQRGLLPLHASAIAGKSGVVAFLANSGQGKSTLAAHLAQRGFRVLADDVCLVDATQPGSAMVIPTAPWLKLWRNSLENLGRASGRIGSRIQRGRQISLAARACVDAGTNFQTGLSRGQ